MNKLIETVKNILESYGFKILPKDANCEYYSMVIKPKEGYKKLKIK